MIITSGRGHCFAYEWSSTTGHPQESSLCPLLWDFCAVGTSAAAPSLYQTHPAIQRVWAGWGLDVCAVGVAHGRGQLLWSNKEESWPLGLEQVFACVRTRSILQLFRPSLRALSLAGPAALVRIMPRTAREHQHRSYKKKITHRDIKPDNILIADMRPDTLTIKLSDFGLSKVVNENKFSTLSATPSHTSVQPGQADYHRLTSQTLRL
ncbi:Pkinase-domain-containing protein [Teratosphaeria destructans]|uniref:Pkinase-domain-containing protein n=1 Tax=Teratosphaeria destructans TaxID=418781 RepID=A0A9W7SQ15_9PEZI|nr:Pkinase-domain-containing protein [Teratosphaeria destructans]